MNVLSYNILESINKRMKLLTLLGFLLSSVNLFAQFIGTGQSQHTIVVNSKGTVYNWGDNYLGALGNLTNSDYSTPTEVYTGGVLNGKTITQVSAGNYHSMALGSDGTVYTWGGNVNGQLGDATNTHKNYPVAVDLSGTIVTQISAGYSHSITLNSNGDIFSWGYNDSGQLGYGALTSYNSPVPTYGPVSFTKISAGGYHNLALGTNGKLYAWGNNTVGQLGNNSNTNSLYKVVVYSDGILKDKEIAQISAGFSHSVAVDSEGKVYAWGDNTYGQLGDGTFISKNYPVEVNTGGVLSGKTIIQVAAGYAHTIALASDGTVYTWGISDLLGGNNSSHSNIPVAVSSNELLSGKTITQIGAGWFHSIVLDSDGLLYAWGSNYQGQLGDGTFIPKNYPVAIDQSVIGPLKLLELIELSPLDNAIIGLDLADLVLTFNKPVTAQTGKNITIYNASNSIVEQIDAASSKVNVSGNQVTITLEAALSNGDYYVMIDAGAFSAADNDEFAGIIDITTWNFTVKATDEVPGKAISFPGSGSNYVSVPYSALLNPSDNFTIEFWASIEGNQNTFSCPLSSQTTIFDGVTPISSDGYYFYAQNDNRWAAWLGRGTNGGTSTAGWEIIAGPVAQLGKWYHLAMTFSSGTMKFYVNGELQGTANGVSYTPNSSAPFNIGDLGEVQGNYPFNGKVDEVRFWNTARSQQQIQENMHLISSGDTENLVAYFQLNEGSGSTTNDILSGFIGTFSGSPTWINSSIPVGSGMSESTPSFSSGSTTLSNVMVTTTDDFDSPIDLSISQINITPNSFDGVSGTSLSDRYWNINAFGSPGTFSVNLTFTVPSDFTNEGNASAGLYTLYHRSGNDDGSWSAVISGASGLTSSSVTFEGVTSFSQFTIATTDPLPVELISFEGYKAEEGVVLNWQTATEVNNYGFEILRSAQNDTTWNNIGFVEGHGNSNSPKEYSFVDSNPMRGILQYHLKQIDTDGKFEYSEIIEVEIEEQLPTKFELYQNYPNPFNPSTTIKFSIPSVITSGANQSFQTSLKIYDILGREVATLVNENLKPGNYEVKFDAASLSSGMYFYSITTSGKTITKKMVLIR